MLKARVRVSQFRVDGDQFAVLSYGPDVAMRRVPLTSSEQAVARGAVAGKTNAEIARARSVSERTVANQMATVLGKVGITSRMKLASQLRRA